MLTGETREITILSCTVRNFAAFAGQMEPKETIAFVGSLHAAIGDAVLANGGTLARSMGDAVMAFWNAPLMIEAHASHACRAALEMLATVDRLNEEDAFGFKAADAPTKNA